MSSLSLSLMYRIIQNIFPYFFSDFPINKIKTYRIGLRLDKTGLSTLTNGSTNSSTHRTVRHDITILVVLILLIQIIHFQSPCF